MTTPTGPIVGTASVAITPSTATFTPQLQAALQRARDAVSDAADAMGDAIAREITSGVARAQIALRTLGDGLNDRLDRTLRITETVGGTLDRLGLNINKVGVALGGLGVAAGNAAFTLGALLGTASELSGIMVGLPAVIGSAALVMGTLKLATQGVGDALGAALSGDTEAFSKALEKLSPSAQAVANDVASLDTRIKNLKTSVQERFFEQLSKDFGLFAVQATGVAEKGLPRISTELGKIAGEFLNVARTGTFFGGLQALIDQTVSGLSRWRGVAGDVANALGNLFRVGSQFAGDMIGGVGNLVDQFARWINVASQTGELQRRLQDALDAVATLGRTIANVGQIFGAFWFSAQEAGANFLGVLENLTAEAATFLNSDFGIASLTALMESGATAAAILGDAVGALLPVVGQLAFTLGQALTQALITLRPALDLLIGGFGVLAAEATGGIANAMNVIADVLARVLTAITPLLPVIGQLISLLAEHFAVVLDIITPLIMSFLDSLQPLMPVISELVSTVLSAFITALEQVLTAIQPLIPVLVQLAVKVLTLVANHFVNIFEAVEPLIPVIIELAEQGFAILADILPVIIDTLRPLLPIFADMARQIGSALAPVLPVVAEAFREIFTQLRPLIPQLVQLASDILVTLVRMFSALLQAVAPLLPPLVEIATTILQALMPAFNDLLVAIEPLIPVLGDLALRLLRDAFIPILNALLPLLPILIDAFIKLLPSIMAILPPLVDLIVTLTPIIELAAKLAEVLLIVLSPAIVSVLVTINELRAIGLTLLAAALDNLLVTVKIVWDSIVTTIRIAWTIIKGIFDVIISLLQGDFSEAWRRLQRLVEDVWNQIKGFFSRALSDITGQITEWGPKIFNAVFTALADIAGVFSSKGREFVTHIANAIKEIINWFLGLPTTIRLIFADAGKWLFNAGMDIVRGLINGMADVAKNIGSWVNDNIVNPIKNAVTGAVGFLMGSPSKWMAKRGQWVVQGLAVGMDQATGEAVDATVNLVNAVKAPVQGAFDGSALDLSTMLGATSFAAPAAAATSGAQSTAVTFAPGAVVVSFEGVVPSEADALRTGQAVAQGIVDTLARRDAQLAVRVM